MSWRAPILIAIGLVFGVLALSGTFTNSGGYKLSAEFSDASGLRANYFVKIDGVTVGRVASVTVSRRDTAIVSMDINRSALPIGRNVTATIKPNSFFGEHYVDLNPGNVTHPAPSGTRIPLSRTSEATELDQLLDVLDPQTRVALAIFLSESGDALVGRGHDLATTLSMLPGTLQDAQQLVANLGIDNRALGQLIDRSSLLVGAIAGQRAALGRLVSSADGALQTLASRNAGLAATLQRSPGVVSQVYATLGYLQAAAQRLIPAAHGIVTTARPLTGVLQALPGFASAATPTLSEARQLAPLLTQLGTQATPVIEGLESPTAQLVRFSSALGPVSNGLSQSIEDLLGYYEGYGRALQDKDAAGHIYRPAQTYADLSQIVSMYEQGLTQQRRQRADRGVRVPQLNLARHGAAPNLPVAPSAHAPATPAAPTTPSVPVPPVQVPSVPMTPPAGQSPGASRLLNYLLGP